MELVNLGDDISKNQTTRVIRIYQQKGPEYSLLDRIDWELPRVNKQDVEKLQEKLQPHRGKVDGIIIKDMAKGVIDGDLISSLCKVFEQEEGRQGGPPWFISSKEWKPDWINQLPRHAVRLFIVPQVAAHAACEKSGFSRWITGDESVTKEALECMKILGVKFPKAMICVLPLGLSVLAHAGSENEAVLYKQPIVGEGLYAEGVPMASVFLPVLVSHLLEYDDWVNHEEDAEEDANERILVSALSFVDTWMQNEVKRITESKTWKENEQKLIIYKNGLPQPLEKSKQSSLGRWSTNRWQDSNKEWKQAYENRGVIYREIEIEEEAGVLEIKRATIEVDGYVCCVEEKREVLRRLTAEIQSFKPADGDSKSFMLKASPGAGKSYLIKKLAELHQLQLLEFNITSLLTRNDLLDCFDTIVTTQARARDKKYLVFFDEIDSHLEGHPVYDAFLRPLEEGLYVRAGKAFYIGPCIWIFAGTRDPAPKKKKKKNPSFLKIPWRRREAILYHACPPYLFRLIIPGASHINSKPVPMN